MEIVDIYARFNAVRRRFFLFVVLILFIVATEQFPEWRPSLSSQFNATSNVSEALAKLDLKLKDKIYQDDDNLRGALIKIQDLERLLLSREYSMVSGQLKVDEIPVPISQTHPLRIGLKQLQAQLALDYPEFVLAQTQKRDLLKLVFSAKLLIGLILTVSLFQLYMLWPLLMCETFECERISRRRAETIKIVEGAPMLLSAVSLFLLAVILFFGTPMETETRYIIGCYTLTIAALVRGNSRSKSEARPMKK